MKSEKKRRKELNRRYGRLVDSMDSYYDHLDLRHFDELDDEVLEFVLQKVKGVDMLDLNDTQVTNAAIALLTKLEYVKELRVKECRNLDDGCIGYLNQLTALRFLNVKATRITINGLLQLRLPDLGELLFSADDPEEAKLQQLQQQLPGCSFVVNGASWHK